MGCELRLEREDRPSEDALRTLHQLRSQIEGIREEIAATESSLCELRGIGGWARWPQIFKLYSLKLGLAKRLDEMQARYRMVHNSYLQLRRDEARRSVDRAG